MRNLVNWNQSVGWSISDPDPNPCEIGGQFGSNTSPTLTRLSRSSGRSDLIKSNHVIATPYHAHDIRCSREEEKYWANCQRRCGKPSSLTRMGRVEWSGLSTIADLYLTMGFTPYGSGQTRYYLPIERTATTAKVHNAVNAAILRMEVDLGETLGNVNELGTLLGRRVYLAARALAALLTKDRRRAGLYLSEMIAANSLRGPRPRKGYNRDDRARKRPKISKGRIDQALDSASNGYLEGVFGWAPFIRDTMAIRDAIVKELQREGTHYSVTRKSAEKRNAATFLGPSEAPFRFLAGTIQQGTQIGVQYRIDRHYIAALSSLGLTNPLATLWQLLPLSFVVDWFVSIGSFLRGLTVGHGLAFESGYKTWFTRSDYKAHEYIAKNAYQVGEWTGVPFVKVKGFGMRRLPLYTFPAPKLTMRFSLNFNKALTAVALVTKLSGRP